MPYSELTCLITIDDQAQIIDFNPGAEELFGCARAGAMGQDLAEVIVAGKDQERARRDIDYYLAIHGVASIGQRICVNARRVQADGESEFPVELTLMRMRHDVPPAFTVYARDLSLRAHSAATMAIRNQLQSILHGVSDGVIAQDPLGNIIYGNDVAAWILGFKSIPALLAGTMDSIAKQYCIEDESGHPVVLPELMQWLAGQALPSMQLTVRLKSREKGDEKWLIVTLSPVLDAKGHLQFALYIIQDVTDQRRVERELLTALQRQEREATLWRSVLSQIGDSVVLADAEGHFTFVNTAARRLRGDTDLSLPALEVETAYQQLDLDGNLIEPAQCPIQRAVRGETVTEEEWLLARADGTRVRVQSSATPVLGNDGSALGAVMTLRDVTSQRQLLAELERSNQIKDEFLAILSHELRTPLTPILGWVSLLRQNAPLLGIPKLPELFDQAFESIERNAELQRGLVNDLLDASTLLSGNLTINPRRKALRPIVQEAIDAATAATSERGVKIEAWLATDLPEQDIDPERLKQALYNVIHNAIKFSTRSQRVEVRLTRQNGAPGATQNWALIEVADWGQGINPDFLPLVYEVFRQGDSSYTRRHGGLGLGLTIARAIIELHGGTISAASPGAGLGSTFSIKLPLP